MSKSFASAALLVAGLLLLNACAGTKLRNSFDEANAHTLIHFPPSPAQGTSSPQTQIVVHAVPAFKPAINGEQALLDSNSVVRNGRSVNFSALDNTQTARVTFDCPSHTGTLRENGVLLTFSTAFASRVTQAALEACGELPMPQPLSAEQRQLVNSNSTKADYEREHTDYICGSFTHMSMAQRMSLIDTAKTDPGVREEIEPCIRSLRDSSYQ